MANPHNPLPKGQQLAATILKLPGENATSHMDSQFHSRKRTFGTLESSSPEPEERNLNLGMFAQPSPIIERSDRRRTPLFLPSESGSEPGKHTSYSIGV
jgi:hypothetical protein